jgi:hypothetical protein
MNIEAAFSDPAARTDRLQQIESGAGDDRSAARATGLLAGKADARIGVSPRPMCRRCARHRALSALRQQAMQKISAEEQALRQRVSIDIPAFSPAADPVLERCATRSTATTCRRARLRARRPHGQGRDRRLQQGGHGAVRRADAARQCGARTPVRLFEGGGWPGAGEQQKLAEAWPVMRAAQQLAAHERTVEALKQTENLRLTQRQSQVLKHEPSSPPSPMRRHRGHCSPCCSAWVHLGAAAQSDAELSARPVAHRGARSRDPASAISSSSARRSPPFSWPRARLSRRGLCPGWFSPLIKTVVGDRRAACRHRRHHRRRRRPLAHSSVRPTDGEGQGARSLRGGIVPPGSSFSSPIRRFL